MSTVARRDQSSHARGILSEIALIASATRQPGSLVELKLCRDSSVASTQHPRKARMASILRLSDARATITEYSDWLIFVERLNEAVRAGRVRTVPVVKRVWASDEEWFLDPETGEIYVYCAPDSPSLPIWERLDVLKHLEATDPAPLSVFKTGPITVMTAHIMKMKLETLVGSGLVEALTPPAP